MTHLVRLPKAYGNDALDRLLEQLEHADTRTVRENKRFVWVEASRSGLTDLLGDARHYSEGHADPRAAG